MKPSLPHYQTSHLLPQFLFRQKQEKYPIEHERRQGPYLIQYFFLMGLFLSLIMYGKLGMGQKFNPNQSIDQPLNQLKINVDNNFMLSSSDLSLINEEEFLFAGKVKINANSAWQLMGSVSTTNNNLAAEEKSGSWLIGTDINNLQSIDNQPIILGQGFAHEKNVILYVQTNQLNQNGEIALEGIKKGQLNLSLIGKY